MAYADSERKVHYEGGVVSRQSPDEMRSDAQDVWLTKGEQSTIDHMIATGSVVLTEPGRTARGERLVYTGSDRKAVLTGANARVEDAEQGSTTGEELTFYLGGERIRVAGRQGAGRVKSTHRVGEGGKQR
jgi:lipopolysaccharide export system protein LptA